MRIVVAQCFLTVLFATLASIAVAQSRIEFTTFDSAALFGNPAGDPSTRSASVYLPPSYESSSRRYPVMYLLHGTGGNERSFRDLRSVVDSTFGSGRSQEIIVVVPDGSSRYAASFYENSELNGNHRNYIAEDLVAHIDANYRTIDSRDSRGVAGHSTGGYGALLFAMKESDVFGAAYSLSGGGLCFTRPECATYLGGDVAQFTDGFSAFLSQSDDEVTPGESLGLVSRPEEVVTLFQKEMYSMASAFSPNLANEPLLVDVPWETPTLEVVPEVRDRWFEHDMFVLLPQYIDELKSLRGLALDAGEQDEFGLAGEATALHEALEAAGVPHEFEIFQGRHIDRIQSRLVETLAFMSDRLVFEAPAECDFDEDGRCDVRDLSDQTLFSIDLVVGSSDVAEVERFDLTKDSVVDQADLDRWLVLAAEYQGFAEPFVPGDTNLDGRVDFVDFLAVAENFDLDDRNWADGDFFGDRKVGFDDFLEVSQNFGSRLTPNSVAPVPEPRPHPIVMGLLGCCWRLGKRRSKPNSWLGHPATD